MVWAGFQSRRSSGVAGVDKEEAVVRDSQQYESSRVAVCERVRERATVKTKARRSTELNLAKSMEDTHCTCNSRVARLYGGFWEGSSKFKEKKGVTFEGRGPLFIHASACRRQKLRDRNAIRSPSPSLEHERTETKCDNREGKRTSERKGKQCNLKEKNAYVIATGGTRPGVDARPLPVRVQRTVVDSARGRKRHWDLLSYSRDLEFEATHLGDGQWASNPLVHFLCRRHVPGI